MADVCVCVDEIEEDDFSGLKTPQREETAKCGCVWLVTYLSCHKLFSVQIRFNRFLLTFSLSSEDELKLSLNITAVELTLDETSFLQSVDGEKEASPACFDHLFYLRSIIQLLTHSSIVLFRRFLMTVA